MWRNLRLQTANLKPAPPAGIYVRNMLPNDLHEAEKRQGWQMLWDGQTTRGWRGALRDAFPVHGWLIKDGELSVRESGGDPAQAGGDIVTLEEFARFEVQLDFKLTPGANSGIKYLVSETMDPKGSSALGLEYQLLDDEKHPDARMGVDGNRTLASLYDLIPSTTAVFGRRVPRGVDVWHHARIVVPASNHVEHWLDGFKVVEYVRGSDEFKALVAKSKYKDLPGFGLGEKGRILLQDHGNTVYFRSIKVRRLP
jgi:hypothetical protein